MNLRCCLPPPITVSAVQFPNFKVPLSSSGAIMRSNEGYLGSDEARALEELDEDLVDKLVLGDGLNHQHPLLPQLR